MAYNNISVYTHEKHCQILTNNELQVKAFTMFGHIQFHKAVLPLDNHYHKDRIEFAIVVKGTQKYIENSHEYTLFGGDVFTAYADEVHSSGESPQSVRELLWFQLDISESNNFLGLSSPWSEQLYSQVLNYRKRLNRVTASQLTLLKKAFQKLSNGSKSEKMIGHSLFLSFLTELTQSEEQNAPIISSDIQKASNYIKSHTCDFIELTTLAGVSGLSVSRFKTKFYQQIGMSPREYINYIKIELAKGLLLQKEKTITEIAFGLGFSSSNYFSMVFKQFTGTTPTTYRSTSILRIDKTTSY